MQNIQRNIVFRSDDGLDTQGSIIRLALQTVVFEVPNPTVTLRLSQVLEGFKVLTGDSAFYAGRAVVRNIIHTGHSVVCEATLDRSLGNVLLDAASAHQHGGYWQERFEEFVQGWQREYRVLPEFKSVIADMQSFLEELRIWLDRLETEIQSLPKDDAARLEQFVISELKEPVTSAIDSFVDPFENIASRLGGEIEAVHRIHLRRQLHPLLLTSPFAYRTFTKPLGYAGDYEVVDMMLRSPDEGKTLFAKMVNIWLVGQAPAEAHRNRVAYLVRKLVEETLRVSAAGQRAHIFNLGCGPAEEVGRFLNTEAVSDFADMTLLDFNEETITQLRRKLDHIRVARRPRARFEVIRKSVQQVLKDASRAIKNESRPRYDFVYCAGLFDYLTDPVCKHLMNVFYDMLAPEGLLVATNVSDAMNQTRPFRYSMEYMLDWHLIYRDGGGFRKLAPDKAPPDAVVCMSDTTGVNVFIEVRKPRHG